MTAEPPSRVAALSPPPAVGVPEDRRPWLPPLRLFLAALVILGVLVGLRLHGFSLPVWHQVIDGSPAPEILVGEARMIRGDEWFVRLPLAFAQAAHDPPFPRHNTNIGMEQDLILPLRVPIWHPIALIRPTLWGFFVGNDLGMAWMWWSRLVGLFVVWLCVFFVVGGRRLGLAALGASALVMAPLFHFWSLQAVPIVLFTGLALLGSLGLLEAKSRAGILGSGLLLAWSGCGVLLEFYPPYQLVLAYLVLALLAGYLISRRGELPPRPHPRVRVGAATLAALAALAACLGFYLDAGDAIQRALQTAYPGHRVSTGGDYPLWRLLSNDLCVTGRVELEGERDIGAAGDLAAFWLFWPVLAIGAACRRATGSREHDPLSIALIVYLGLLSAFAAVGVPEWLARGTLLSWVPGPRTALGLGLADLVLVIRHFSLGEQRVGLHPRRAALISLAWIGALAACAWALHGKRPELGLPATGLLLLLNGLLAYAILRCRRPKLVLATLAVGLAWCSLWFNPVVRGGGDYLVENPLSERILAIDREAGGETFWVSYGSHQIANLFRVLGVRALNGVHPLPQLELWERFDRHGRHRRVYNRYAHVTFQPNASSRVSFRLNGLDGFTVFASPTAASLRSLGVTHLLVRSRDPEVFDGLPGIERLGSVGRNQIFRLLAEAPGSDSEVSRKAEPIGIEALHPIDLPPHPILGLVGIPELPDDLAPAGDLEDSALGALRDQHVAVGEGLRGAPDLAEEALAGITLVGPDDLPGGGDDLDDPGPLPAPAVVEEQQVPVPEHGGMVGMIDASSAPAPHHGLAIGIHDGQQIELAKTQQQLPWSAHADLSVEDPDRVRMVDVADQLVGPGLRLGTAEQLSHPRNPLPPDAGGEQGRELDLPNRLPGRIENQDRVVPNRHPHAPAVQESGLLREGVDVPLAVQSHIVVVPLPADPSHLSVPADTHQDRPREREEVAVTSRDQEAVRSVTGLGQRDGVEHGPAHVEESDLCGSDRAVDVDSGEGTLRIVTDDTGARGIWIAADVIDVSQRAQTLEECLVP